MPTHSELTILGALGEPCWVRLLSRSGAHCLVSSRNMIPPGTVARIKTDHGLFLGEVLSCHENSHGFRISIRSLTGHGNHAATALQPDRPESVLTDLLNLNAHLMACEA